MIHLVFLLEEPSIKEVLKVVLPKILPPPEIVSYQLVPHEGKNDLEKSIPRKLRARGWGWQKPDVDVRFVIVRDRDRADCHAVKKRLEKLCAEAGRPDSLIRIVCGELESWFLGDLSAVETAFSKKGIAAKQETRKFRDPDQVVYAKKELKKLVPGYQAVRGSRAIAPHMNLQGNRSQSFRVFLEGVEKVSAMKSS